MNFKFVISKQLLFVTALLQGTEMEGWVDLQNTLWDKYRSGYKLLQGKSDHIFANEEDINSLAKTAEEISVLIDEGLKSPLFKTLLENAISYKEWLEKEWEDNTDAVLTALHDILKVDLPSETFTVFVMGDLVYVGRYLGDHKISWGHKDEWENYSLVYLAHEALHELFSYGNLEHAIIELATDNELRIRLNRGGEYFICNGKNVGHSYLRKLEQDLIPDWKVYLENKKDNIFDFVRLVKSKLVNPSLADSIYSG